MADTPASEESHESARGHSAPQPTSKTPAVKDKECQYCHQHFTSSSLGRHLDQFISKKKPDGIHNVEEIRRLRGGITRRTARGGKRLDEESQSQQDSPAPSQQRLPPPSTDINRVPPEGYHVRLNRLNWQATGVITDPSSLDSHPAAVSSASPAMVSSPVGTKRSFSTFAQDLNNPTTTVENARALELALREVLDSVRAAAKHAGPKPSPFPFDLQSQTFPSLCLAVLPAPPTLFQASPFSTLQSIPISPPGPDQLQPLRQKLSQMVDLWKWQSLRRAQPTASNIADEADFLTRAAAQYTESSLNHVDTSFQNWMAHPPDIRGVLWNVELLRAYKSEQDKVTEMEDQLERLQQEANQLMQQVEYLSRCQWPREMALWPPERKTFDKHMRDELRMLSLTKVINGEASSEDFSRIENTNTRGDKWDFDKLVNKWKTHVREDRNRRIPPIAAAPAVLPTSSEAGHSSTTTTAGGPEFKRKSDPTVNGLSNGNGSTGEHGDERRRTPRLPLNKNISIISDL